MLRAFIVGAFLAATALPIEASEPPARPTAEDLGVLVAVVTHFCGRSDTEALNERGTLLIAPVSAELWSEATPDDHVTGAEHVAKLVPRGALEDFHSRNGQAFSMESLGAKSPCARTATSEELEGWPFKFDAKRFKTISYFHVPGYSPDRSTAFVSFNFRWSIHGAWAFYLLQRQGSSWKVVASDLGFAV